MSKQDIVILYLSIILAAVQFQLYREVKHAAYLDGRMSVYQDQAASPDDGICYARKGCK